ncbi:hypothetical protein J5N97_002897 [Dioscorea zingiberensis]|uniref:Uncharacterized protein n=1 Tax=Dioscorea zingiberensis TaxID=325984 RepID=A0A9D5HQ23_9LILI|nr:hypothetical protein J5N97_002897 [Dioscorea zingiberensis]
MINAFTIGHDSSSWKDPNTFHLSRFGPGGKAAGIDFKGNFFDLFPFGSRRRSCPGMQLGLYALELAVAAHAFFQVGAARGDEADRARHGGRLRAHRVEGGAPSRRPHSQVGLLSDVKLINNGDFMKTKPCKQRVPRTWKLKQVKKKMMNKLGLVSVVHRQRGMKRGATNSEGVDESTETPDESQVDRWRSTSVENTTEDEWEDTREKAKEDTRRVSTRRRMTNRRLDGYILSEGANIKRGAHAEERGITEVVQNP